MPTGNGKFTEIVKEKVIFFLIERFGIRIIKATPPPPKKTQNKTRLIFIRNKDEYFLGIRRNIY